MVGVGLLVQLRVGEALGLCVGDGLWLLVRVGDGLGL